MISDLGNYPLSELGTQEYYNDSGKNISVFDSNDAQIFVRIFVGLKGFHYCFINNPNPSYGF